MLTELALLTAGSSLLSGKRRPANLGQALSAPARPSPAPSPLARGKRLLHDLKTAVLGDERLRQQATLDAELSAHLEQAKRTADRDLIGSAAATGCALLAPISPLFWWLGAIGVVYLSRELFTFIARDFRRGHYFSVYLVGLGMLVGMLATNHLLLAALSGVAGGFLLRIVKKAEDQAERRLTQTFAWHPARVWLERDGVELEVPFATLVEGDTVVVHAGEVIAVDGVIRSGEARIDQHVLTGESQPVERGPGERVFAGTLLRAGRLAVRVDTAAEDTLAARIAQVLEHTQSYKDTLVGRGRRFADRLLPVELSLGAGALWLAGPTTALAVLWSNLGGNMAVLGPLTVLNYLHILSRQGILVKDGRVFETLGRVDTVVFDKTGTLTLEQPEVAEVHALAGYDPDTVLRHAAAAEFRQAHPVARAILAEAARRGLALPAIEDAHYALGFGIQVRSEGRLVQVGSARYMDQANIAMPAAAAPLRAAAEALGHSLVHVAVDGAVAGLVELRPALRPEAAGMVQALRARGLELAILSGDREPPTRHLAESLGIERYFAEVLPEGKADRVRQLVEEGRCVCFVGDGLNDAIALRTAQVSVSLKGASSLATDTAQIVFLDGALERLPLLFQLAAEFEGTLRVNQASSVVPGALNLASLLFLHSGLGTAMALCFLGSLAGLGTSLSPLLRHQEEIALGEG